MAWVYFVNLDYAAFFDSYVSDSNLDPQGRLQIPSPYYDDFERERTLLILP